MSHADMPDILGARPPWSDVEGVPSRGVSSRNEQAAKAKKAFVEIYGALKMACACSLPPEG